MPCSDGRRSVPWQNAKGFERFSSAGDEIPEVPVSGIGTTDKLIKERPDMVKKFISGTLQTMTYMRNETNKEISSATI